MNINLAAADIARVADTLKALIGDDDDERAYLDMLEGETDLNSLVSRLLASMEDDEGQKVALGEQMAVRKERRDRCDARIDAKRGAVLKLMEAARLTKLLLPEATISVGETKPRLAVNDADAVPEPYTVMKRTPSLDAIKAAFPTDGELPNWLRVEPGRPSVTIRRR